MSFNPDHHKRLLELSDSIGALSRRILDNTDADSEVQTLLEEYGTRLDEFREQRLRRQKSESHKNDIDINPASTLRVEF